MADRITLVLEDAQPVTWAALLDVLASHNAGYLQRHPRTPSLRAAGVRYVDEPAGSEDWRDVATTIARREGDCEDLACARVGERRAAGFEAVPELSWSRDPRDPRARLYHVRDRYRFRDGVWRVEDPSVEFGMR